MLCAVALLLLPYAVLARSFTPLSRSGSTSATLTSQPQVFCIDDGAVSWNPGRALWMWAPLHVEIEAADPKAEIRVLHASEDDLHHAVEAWWLNAVGEGSGSVDVEGIVSKAPRTKVPFSSGIFNFFRLDLLNECPSVFSKHKNTCTTNLSPFGKSCISVKANKGAGTSYTITTSSEFRIELIAMLVAGLMVGYMSGVIAKSKIFQYANGASFGVMFGALLAVILVLRRRAARRASAVAGATAAYAVSVFAFLKSYFARALASHWELVLGYLLASAAVGLFTVRAVRSDPEHKHRARVVTKWLVRGLAVWMVQHSTYSGAAQAGLLVLLLLWYVRYSLRKAGFLPGAEPEIDSRGLYDARKQA